MPPKLGRETRLLTDVTATDTGDAKRIRGSKVVFYAEGDTSAGAGAATIVVEAKPEGGSVWVLLGTISLTLGTTKTADGFAIDAPWGEVRMRVSAISGTDATVDGWMTGAGAH
jgi:hypothetical protein